GNPATNPFVPGIGDAISATCAPVAGSSTGAMNIRWVRARCSHTAPRYPESFAPGACGRDEHATVPFGATMSRCPRSGPPIPEKDKVQPFGCTIDWAIRGLEIGRAHV